MKRLIMRFYQTYCVVSMWWSSDRRGAFRYGVENVRWLPEY